MNTTITPETTPAAPASPPVPLAAISTAQLAEFTGIMDDIKITLPGMRSFPAALKALQDETSSLTVHLTDLRRAVASQVLSATRSRTPCHVSDSLARGLAATYIAQVGRSDRLDAITSVPAQRDALIAFARDTLGLSTRAALTTNEIPLPAQYGSELRDLISDFGVVRSRMLPYPIGMGTARPARMGAHPAFGSISMSVPFPEKSPSFSFASLESHKVGGIIRLPRELDEQSLLSMGRFLGRYGAAEFARLEDEWGFLADGGGSCEQVTGIVQIARNTNHQHILAPGDVSPSDATLDDFRLLRTKVAKAALNGKLSAYYLDSTWETHLPSFRSAGEPNVYQRLPDGTATLDGYPIVWTDVLTPYSIGPDPNKPLAVFGALSFWWMGEHGMPRIDTSDHVWFQNDQLAVRFIEEIDFDYAAEDATAVLLTAPGEAPPQG